MDALQAYAAELASILESSYGHELTDISVETVTLSPTNPVGFPVINASIDPDVTDSLTQDGLQVFLTQFGIQHGFECSFDRTENPVEIQFYPSPHIDFPLYRPA